MEKSKFIEWIYPQAKALGEIDPSFVTAQAALESGWAAKAIGNNLFGITKGSSWKGKTQLVLTTEYFSTKEVKFTEPEKVISITRMSNGKYKYKVKRLFRDYVSVADCLNDHLALLKRPQFADAWPFRKDGCEYVVHLVDSIGPKYATDPNYVKSVTSMIDYVRKYVASHKL